MYFNWMAVSLEANLGRDTNYDPQFPLPPVPGKSRFVQFNTTFRPARGLTVDNTYFLYSLRDVNTNQNFFNNHILRSKWNYQFTRKFSLRLIGQYNATLANPAFTSLQHAKNFNGDVLFTYLVHPGTAIYVGYNSDLANINRNLSPDPYDNTEVARVPHPFLNDGRQVFVKVSYLVRF